MPITYVLHQQKSADVYQLIYEFLKIKFSLSISLAMVDFDQALFNSLRISFPSIIIRGCQFHFVNAIKKWLQKRGMKNIWDDNKEKIRDFTLSQSDPSSEIQGSHILILVFIIIINLILRMAGVTK
jgi:hypothetical protein